MAVSIGRASRRAARHAGRDGGDDPPGGDHAAPHAAHPAAAGEDQGEGQRARSRDHPPAFGDRVKTARHRDLHAPVRDHDRRRPADRAVPRHPAGAADDKPLRKAIQQVKDEVEAGSTFADALSKHPKVFADLYTNMVAAGEVGGILDTILNRLAVYMEKAARLKSKIKGAMIYPACIVAAAVAGDRHPAHLRDPGLRRALLELRPGAARADAVRHQLSQLHHRNIWFIGGHGRWASSCSSCGSGARNGAARRSTASCSACRSSAT